MKIQYYHCKFGQQDESILSDSQGVCQDLRRGEQKPWINKIKQLVKSAMKSNNLNW